MKFRREVVKQLLMTKFIKIFSLVEDIKIDLETPLDEEDDE